MDVKIREEQAADYKSVFNLIEEAFKDEALSDHREQFLVERLRKSDAFIPDLALVAELNHEIIGYILLTKIKIKNKKDEFSSLALAPVAVLPEYQKKGIGGKLINESHKIAQSLGFNSIILLGHEDYYPRFGYLPVNTFGIDLPFDAPKENCMAVELSKNALAGVSGMVEYPKAFDE